MPNEPLINLDEWNLIKFAPDSFSDAGKEIALDIDPGSVKVLRVSVLANESGKLVNGRVYPGVSMKQAYPLWTSTDYKKPVCRHHDHQDIIGKVVQAKFTPAFKGDAFTYDYQNPAVKELAHGSGTGILTTAITLPEAIGQILRGELDAVSTGAVGTDLICSICGESMWDWNSPCRHTVMQVYEVEDNSGKRTKTVKKLCYGISIGWSPKEVSFVAIPALSTTKLLSIATSDSMTDSEKRRCSVVSRNLFDFDNNVYVANDVCKASIIMQDKDGNIYDLSAEDPEMANKIATSTVTIDLNKTAKGTDASSDIVVNGSIVTNKPVTTTKGDDSTSTNVNSGGNDDQAIGNPENKEGGNPASDSSSSNESRTPNNAEGGTAATDPSANSENRVSGDGAGTPPATDVAAAPGSDLFADDDEFVLANVVYSILKDGLDLLEDADDEEDTYKLDNLLRLHDIMDGVFSDSEVMDAKLSAAQRKKLKSSQFCGPNKSFPVPDCKHVTAAKRLLSRYKGPGKKEDILACIEAKAKRLGCTSNKDAELLRELQAEIKSLKVELNLVKADKEAATEKYTEVVAKLDELAQIAFLLKKLNDKSIDKQLSVLKSELKDMDTDELVKSVLTDTFVKDIEESYTSQFDSVNNDKIGGKPTSVKKITKISGSDAGIVTLCK